MQIWASPSIAKIPDVCLFLDRCADAILVEACGLVRDDLDLLERVIDRYSIATTLLP